MKEIQEKIIKLSESISKDKRFLLFCEELLEKKDYETYLRVTANNSIPTYIVDRAKRFARNNGVEYGHALLTDRIYTLKKRIEIDESELASYVNTLKLFNDSPSPAIEPEIAEPTPEKQETNGLEKSPKLSAIGSPTTINQVKSNIKRLKIALHPDDKPVDRREACNLIFSELTKLETELVENWRYFDPLANFQQSHIQKIMCIECGLTKYKTRFDKILSTRS